MAALPHGQLTSKREDMALSDTSCEAIARIEFFQELHIPSVPVLILADSQTAIDIADGTAINHTKTKHAHSLKSSRAKTMNPYPSGVGMYPNPLQPSPRQLLTMLDAKFRRTVSSSVADISRMCAWSFRSLEMVPVANENVERLLPKLPKLGIIHVVLRSSQGFQVGRSPPAGYFAIWSFEAD
jgi:hypothetical protein